MEHGIYGPRGHLSYSSLHWRHSSFVARLNSLEFQFRYLPNIIQKQIKTTSYNIISRVIPMFKTSLNSCSTRRTTLNCSSNYVYDFVLNASRSHQRGQDLAFTLFFQEAKIQSNKYYFSLIGQFKCLETMQTFIISKNESFLLYNIYYQGKHDH